MPSANVGATLLPPASACRRADVRADLRCRVGLCLHRDGWWPSYVQCCAGALFRAFSRSFSGESWWSSCGCSMPSFSRLALHGLLGRCILWHVLVHCLALSLSSAMCTDRCCVDLHAPVISCMSTSFSADVNFVFRSSMEGRCKVSLAL